MRSHIHWSLFGWGLILLLPAPASAQRLERTWESRSLHQVESGRQSPVLQPDESASFGRLAGGGILGGLAAIGVGQIAYELGGGGRICGDDPCGLWAGVVSTIILEPVLIPVGVHLANHSQGNVGLAFLASAGAGIGGLLLDHEARIGAPLIVLTPLAQIVVAALVERATTHPEAQDP